MKLYSDVESGNSWKVRILLEQIGIPYEIAVVDTLKREHKTERFINEFNPRGQVPVLEHEGRRYWDSAACLVYIARKFEREGWLPIDAAAMAEVMQWVSLAASKIQFGLQYARRGVMRGRWIAGNLEQLQAIGKLALGALEWRLKDHDWPALDQITIADNRLLSLRLLRARGGTATRPLPWNRRLGGALPGAAELGGGTTSADSGLPGSAGEVSMNSHLLPVAAPGLG